MFEKLSFSKEKGQYPWHFLSHCKADWQNLSVMGRLIRKEGTKQRYSSMRPEASWGQLWVDFEQRWQESWIPDRPHRLVDVIRIQMMLHLTCKDSKTITVWMREVEITILCRVSCFSSELFGRCCFLLVWLLFFHFVISGIILICTF